MIDDCLGSEGQEIVEYALVLPVLLLLVFGIIDLGRTIFVYNSMANAAREGARAGIVWSASVDDIKAAVTERAGGLGLASGDVTVITATGQITVEVAYDHSLLTGPLVAAAGGNSVIELKSVATMQTEY